MDQGTFRLPLSPGTRALFDTFTTLYDDFTLGDAGEMSFSASEEGALPDNLPRGKISKPLTDNRASGLGRQNHDNGLSHGVETDDRHQHSARPSMAGTLVSVVRTKDRYPKMEELPGYICFSSTSGKLLRPPKRSAFTDDRKEEVKRMRKLGACLRCKIRKITCTGDDPCKACVDVASAKLGSRALMWMDCIRPSFEAVCIFDKKDTEVDVSKYETTVNGLLGNVDELSTRPTLEMNLESASEYLALWLVNETSHPTTSLSGFVRSKQFGEMLDDTLGEDLSNKFRLLIYLTNSVIKYPSRSPHRGYTIEERCRVVNQLGILVLNQLEHRLRPARLEASRSKVDNLRALFIVLFGMSMTARYKFLNMVRLGLPHLEEKKRRIEGLLRLLSHYLIYIGGVLSLVDDNLWESNRAQCANKGQAQGDDIQERCSHLVVRDFILDQHRALVV